MLYVVEMELPDRSLLGEWTLWYAEHVRKLLTVPGFLSAQRFEATTRVASPFVAVYTVAGAGVMTSDAYRARFGPTSAGKWRELMTNWNRNLLDGLSEAPDVPMDGWLAIVDRRSDSSAPLPAGFASLRPVGLDCTIVERGMRAGTRGEAAPVPREDPDRSVRVLRPLTPRLRPVGGAAD